MKQPVITFKHQVKLADSLAKIVNSRLAATLPFSTIKKEEPKIHTSHRIALVKAAKKKNG